MMISKEECEKALARIINDDYYFENDPYEEDKASAFDKDVDMIEYLIEEHFEPKENTEEFKHFKLHSYSTLKNQTKEELINYIKMLYHNWKICDEQLKNCIDANTKLKEKYSKILDDVHNYRFETHCMKMTIRNLCEHFGVKSEKELQNIYLNKPYKFEDLKPNMWVWDSYWEECFEIGELYKKKNEIDILIHDNNINKKRYETIKFEENRFYPVQCANEVRS